MDLTYKIVRRLLRDNDVEFSRNKNFDAYDDPTVQRAVRIYRHLYSVEEDLLELGPGGDAVLDEVDRMREPDREDRFVLQLTFADSETRRVCYLSPRDWALLLESDRVSSVLRELLDEADPQTRANLTNSLRELDNTEVSTS
jgi:hypothetical protein